MPSKLHPDNPYFQLFSGTMDVIADAADSDEEQGKPYLQAIFDAQKGNDEKALQEAWRIWYLNVPSAMKVQMNREKHREEIDKREKAIGIVTDKNPPDRPDLLEKIKKACERLRDLYLEGFVAMPNNTWRYLGEDHVF
jgi:hypothetical protein